MRKLDSRNPQSQQKVAGDWHPADILAALKKKGWSFRKLSAHHGYASDSARRVLDVEWLAMEAIVAEAIGVEAATIWPSRYIKERNVNFTGGARKLSEMNVSSPAARRNVKVRQVA